MKVAPIWLIENKQGEAYPRSIEAYDLTSQFLLFMVMIVGFLDVYDL